uniref:Uncharacterized protein n=1 Tax=Strongyloides papillosus TaxID=174720 RepID=A0A0N5B274_STREA
MRFMKYLTIFVLLAVQYSFQNSSVEDPSLNEVNNVDSSSLEEIDLSSTETPNEGSYVNVLTESVPKRVEKKGKLFRGVLSGKKLKKSAEKAKHGAKKAMKKGKQLFSKMVNGVKGGLKNLVKKNKGSRSSSSSDSDSSEENIVREKRFLVIVDDIKY